MTDNEEQEENSKKNKVLGEVIHRHVKDKQEDEDEGLSREELQRKLEERETELGAIAMKAFEKESKRVKKQFKKQYNRDVEINSPEQLNFARNMLDKDTDEDDDDNEGGESLGSTGGQVPLSSSYSIQGENKGLKGKTVKQIYDRYEQLLFRQEHPKGNPMSDDELKELQEHEDIINELWYKHIRPAVLEKRPAYKFQAKKTTICPKCGNVIAQRICPHCGKEVMSEQEWLKRE